MVSVRGAVADGQRGGVDAAERRVLPVSKWAAAGGVILAVELWIVVKWVIGPDFARVPGGPDELPGWMRITLIASQVLLPVLAAGFLYWFVVRPWRRERHVPLEGRISLAMIPASLLDPLANGIQPWIAYNSHMLNWGSPLVELPGWLSYSAPGAAPAFPLPWAPAAYILFPAIGMIGCAVLRAAKRRFPAARGPFLLALCFAFMFVFDSVMEGLVLMPLGHYSYPGGIVPLLSEGRYFELPFATVFHAAGIWVAAAALMYYRDDRGLTFAERGAATLAGGPVKKLAIQVLALVAVMHAIVTVSYHGPGLIWGANAGEYPTDVKERSYFMNQCGPRIDRACPGRDVPASRPGSGYVDWDGDFIAPAGPMPS